MPTPGLLRAAFEASAARHTWHQASGTAFGLPVVPEVNMMSARAFASNTWAERSAKWMISSSASCRCVSSRRRRAARLEVARPRPRVERGAAVAAEVRAVKLGRAGRTAAGSERSSPASRAAAWSNRPAAFSSSTRNATRSPRQRSSSNRRASFSPGASRLFTVTMVKLP